MDKFIAQMYAAALVGAFIGLLWPTVVAYFNASRPRPMYISSGGMSAGGG